MELGIDCVEISRISEDIVPKKNIMKKIFTDNEIQYCQTKKKPSQHYAARFAGKEAIVKAFSCYGINIPLTKIEILNKKNGVPYVNILDDGLKNYYVKISLTHSREMAMAVAMVGKKQKQ